MTTLAARLTAALAVTAALAATSATATPSPQPELAFERSGDIVARADGKGVRALTEGGAPSWRP